NVDARRRLIEGVFAVTPSAELNGATLLLVDDVVTTGATASEAARALLAAGAAAVDVIAVARTLAKDGDIPIDEIPY
ncbi:MAG: phosphoribosyltransferase family protein, partial [Candidatus Poribacteria bacterium]|nr:phosphoribosyltransferase family protein [Candidatus Poribacteria bacterium]